MKIHSVKAAQRLDSRGNPTIQVDVLTDAGQNFRALVPSGASTGTNEAVELRDGDKSMYGGLTVKKAIKNVEEEIGPFLIKQDFDLATDLKKIDRFMKELDGTENKSKLGANAILGVSMACARAGAAAKGVSLYEFLACEVGSKKPYVMPVPFFNVLNGGVHSGNTMAFQEIMIAPVGARSLKEAIRMGSEVYHQLKRVITKTFGASATGIGDEGGFAPPISEPHEALDLLTTAIEECDYTGKVKFGIDPASSEFYHKGKYDMGFKSSKHTEMNAAELSALYEKLITDYDVILLEDPFAEDDWESWTKFNSTCKIELVGDDLLVTNPRYVQEAAEKKACNSMLLKVNQIGTVTEAIEAANLAYSLGWAVFVSHRSGETTDDFIADLCVALRAGHLKSGSPCRGERVAKYNRLMDIEAEIEAGEERCVYAGHLLRHANIM